MVKKSSWLMPLAIAVILTLVIGSPFGGFAGTVKAQGAYLPPYSIYGTPSPPSDVSVMNNTAELWGPYVNTVYFTWFTTSEAIVEALVNGYIQFDSAGVSNAQEYNQLQSYIKSGEIAVNITPNNGFGYIGFNTNMYPLSNVHFRRAIQHLTNYQSIASALLNGVLGIASPYYFIPQVYGTYFSSQEAQAYQQYGTFNLSAAIQELEAAGLVDHPAQGYWTYPNGSQVTPFTLYTSSGTGLDLRTQVLEAMTNNAKTINLTINIVPINFNTLIDSLLPAHNVEMYQLGWSLGSPVSPTWLYYIFGDYILNTYYQDYNDTTAWNLVAKVQFDSATPQLAYNYAIAAATYLQENLPYVMLDWGSNLVPVNVQSWKGYTSEAPYGILFPANIHPVNSTFGSLYRYGQPQNPDTQNIYMQTSLYDFEINGNEYATPLGVSPSNPVQLVPNAAYNYTLSTGSGMTPNGHPFNGTIVTMYFLPNAVWQDGVPMTALDYNFTIWWLDLGGYSSNPYNPSSDTVTIDPGVVVNYTAEAGNPGPEYFGEASGLVDTYVPPSNPYELQIYFNSTSIFNLLTVYGEPILPEHIFASIQPTTFATESASQYLPQEVFSGPYAFQTWSVTSDYATIRYFPSYYLANPYSDVISAPQGQSAMFTMNAWVLNQSQFTSSSGSYTAGYSPVNGASGTLYVLNSNTLQTIATYPLQFSGNGTYTAQVSTSSLAQGTYTLVAQLNWTGASYPYFGAGHTSANNYNLHQYATLMVTAPVPTQTTTTTISPTTTTTTTSATTVPTTKTSGVSGSTILVIVLIVVALVVLGVGVATRRTKPAT